jgi:hypothetical protein
MPPAEPLIPERRCYASPWAASFFAQTDRLFDESLRSVAALFEIAYRW